MTMPYSSTKILIIAALMLIFGATMPFLMVIRVIQPSLWLSFLSYGCTVVGLVLGMYGVSATVIKKNQSDDWEDWRDL